MKNTVKKPSPKAVANELTTPGTGGRRAFVARHTKETRIAAAINLDGTGQYDIKTGIGFLDHMLEQLSRHSLIDITLRAEGDLHIDYHHTTEDSGIVLGECLMKALGAGSGTVAFLLAAEQLVLAFVGGGIGYALGIVLARLMGEKIFGAAPEPTLLVFFVVIGLAAMVTLLGSAIPLRRASRLEPAPILRGE